MATAPKTTRRTGTSTRTTSPRKPARKTSTPSEADLVLAEALAEAALAEPVTETAEPEATEAPAPVEFLEIEEQPELKKRELVDLAVERSGVKKRDAKPAIEAALAILGEALSEGRELNLRPFGKLKVTRMKKGDHGQIINARVRQPQEDENSGDDPLAHAAE